MSRLPAIQTQAASGKVRELLDAVEARLQLTPNMTRVMANSPAVLEAYLSFSGALAGGALSAKLRTKLALQVGELNLCQYCLSAHTARGKMTGLTDVEIEAARTASSSSETEAGRIEIHAGTDNKKGPYDRRRLRCRTSCWIYRWGNRRNHCERRSQHLHELLQQCHGSENRLPQDPTSQARRIVQMTGFVRRSTIGLFAGTVASPALAFTVEPWKLGLFFGIALGAIYAASLRPARRPYADNLMTGAALGIPLWSLISVVALPVFAHQVPAWNAEGIRAHFPGLVGWVSYGAVFARDQPRSERLDHGVLGTRTRTNRGCHLSCHSHRYSGRRICGHENGTMPGEGVAGK